MLMIAAAVTAKLAGLTHEGAFNDGHFIVVTAYL
jgi:hypothetical protein